MTIRQCKELYDPPRSEERSEVSAVTLPLPKSPGLQGVAPRRPGSNDCPGVRHSPSRSARWPDRAKTPLAFVTCGRGLGKTPRPFFLPKRWSGSYLSHNNFRDFRANGSDQRARRPEGTCAPDP